MYIYLLLFLLLNKLINTLIDHSSNGAFQGQWWNN